MTKRRWLDDTDYAIGTGPTNLSDLRLMDTPTPDQVTFAVASVYYDRGDASRVGDGYATAQWIWDVISRAHLAPLLEYLGTADSVKLYIRTDKRDGLKPNPSSAMGVYYCTMLRPILSGQEGVPIARTPYAYQTVALTFKDLVLQPGYL